jgi:hypothetical protein
MFTVTRVVFIRLDVNGVGIETLQQNVVCVRATGTGGGYHKKI